MMSDWAAAKRDKLRWLSLCPVIFVWAAAVLLGAGSIPLNADLQGGDQGAYLQLALDQREGRALSDGNRHPLYSALLIPLAEREVAFFARARWVSLGLGAFFLGLVAWGELRTAAHPFSAFFALVFLGVHAQMYRTVSEVWCEPLLYPLVYLLWWGLDRWGSPRQPRSDSPTTSEPAQENPPAPNKGLLFWVGMGTVAGLAYLTKGTGLQIAGLFFLTALLFHRKKRNLLFSAVAFAIVIAPLVVWNLRTYGDPLYSFASTHNMWFDEADEIWYDDPSTLPTLGSYLRTHTAGQILERFGRGIVLETRMAFDLLGSMWTPPLSDSFPTRARLFLLYKIFFWALVLWGIASRLRFPNRTFPIASPGGWVFFLLLSVAFFLTFGWYAQLTNAPRFLMTLVPIAAILLSRTASVGVAEILEDRFQDRIPRAGKAIRAVAIGFLGLTPILLVGFAIHFQTLTARLPPPQVIPLTERVLDRLRELPEETTVAYGPSHGLPLWMAPGGIAWRPTPWRISFEDFQRTLERENIRYVLVDTETMFRREYLRFLLSPDSESKTGWKLLFRDRDSETTFLLYEVGEER